LRGAHSSHDLPKGFRDLFTTQSSKDCANKYLQNSVKEMFSAFQQQIAPATIRVGQTAYVPVCAHKPWNDSGIDVVSGQVFSFNVPSGEEWIDWQKAYGADGYGSTYLIRPWEIFRRVPQAKWFQLIGTIGKSIKSPVIIGSKLVNFLPAFPGRLYLFANDVPWMYWNNRGMIALRVTRTK
jgi:hypothetical protein